MRRLHYRLRFTKHWHAHRRPYHQRPGSWGNFQTFHHRFLYANFLQICSAQVPVYIAELAPPSKRGRLIGAQQWAITWGIMIMFYICYGCSYIKGTAAFRVPWGLQMIPAILLFFGLFFLPESPRWLAKHGHWDEALDTLALVHAHGDKNDAFVHRELKEIRDEVEFDAKNADVTWKELFKPGMLNRIHIGVFTQIWSQLTGMNVMMYYITVSLAPRSWRMPPNKVIVRLRHGWS